MRFLGTQQYGWRRWLFEVPWVGHTTSNNDASRPGMLSVRYIQLGVMTSPLVLSPQTHLPFRLSSARHMNTIPLLPTSSRPRLRLNSLSKQFSAPSPLTTRSSIRTMIYPGSCYCNKIRYEIDLEDPDQARTSLCHCRNCKVSLRHIVDLQLHSSFVHPSFPGGCLVCRTHSSFHTDIFLF